MRVTAHGAAQLRGLAVDDVRRDPSYEPETDTVELEHDEVERERSAIVETLASRVDCSRLIRTPDVTEQTRRDLELAAEALEHVDDAAYRAVLAVRDAWDAAVTTEHVRPIA